VAIQLLVVLPQGLRPGNPNDVVIDLIQVFSPVHAVVADRAPVGVGSAPEDAQSKGLKMAYVSLGLGVGVRIGVVVQLFKWWRRLGIHRRHTSGYGH
jgi:hypothetical protein